ncbi:MAG: MFS transporter [Crocinitomicaceae bacterium]
MNRVRAYFSSLKDYSRSFWFLCLHMLLFFASFNMLIPEMNEYITSLGGADYKWLILGLWTIAAALSRPISGKIADNISRKSVMFIGVIVSILISFAYPLFLTVSGFLLLRFLHGFSTGFQPTGATALVSDIIPQGKRGEAMGILGVTITLGFSLGQALGSFVEATFSIDGLFYTCGILGLLSLLPVFFIKEDKEKVKANAREKGYHSNWNKIIPKMDEIIAPEVIQPSVIIFLSAGISGMYFLMVPDFSDHLGIANKGMFFAVNVGVVVVTRFVAGKFVDKVGARKNLMVSLSILLIAALITGSAKSEVHFLLSSLVFGLGSAIGSPAVMAWTADLSNPKYKGRGMATMFIALELGFLFGNFMAQLIYDNNYDHFFKAFSFAAAMALAGILYLIWSRKKAKKSWN